MSAPGVRLAVRLCHSKEKVLPPPCTRNSKLPSKSPSKPTRWGTCFRIRISPIAASMPVMTDEGTNSLSTPAREKEKAIWNSPASITAARKAG